MDHIGGERGARALDGLPDRYVLEALKDATWRETILPRLQAAREKADLARQGDYLSRITKAANRAVKGKKWRRR